VSKILIVILLIIAILLLAALVLITALTGELLSYHPDEIPMPASTRAALPDPEVIINNRPTSSPTGKPTSAYSTVTFLTEP